MFRSFSMLLILIFISMAAYSGPIDINKTIELANSGNVDAEFVLGMFYMAGAGVKTDKVKGSKLIEEAASKGSIGAQEYIATNYYLGSSLFNSNNAFKYARNFSLAGNIYATKQLAKMYKDGHGTSIDFKKAFELTESLAQNGDADSQCTLGYMYLLGDCVVRNKESAFYWFKKAVDGGDNYALLPLGKAYLHGYGVKIDECKAFEYFKKAYSKNMPDAEGALGSAYLRGMCVNKDPERAFKMLSNCSMTGNPECQRDLSNMYDQGTGTPQNFRKAYIWYLIASSAYNSDSYTTDKRDALAAKLSQNEIVSAQQEANEISVKIESKQHTKW